MSIRENPIGPPHLMLRHCIRSASQDNNDPVAESRPTSPAFDLTLVDTPREWSVICLYRCLSDICFYSFFFFCVREYNSFIRNHLTSSLEHRCVVD